MVLRREDEVCGAGDGQDVKKWPANGTGGMPVAAERPGGSRNFAEAYNNALKKLDAQLAQAIAGAAEASSQSCVCSASGDLLRTFQWDAHAEMLGREVKELARSLARCRQRRRRLQQGGLAGCLWPGLKPPGAGL
jgi:hypothetical protein